MNAPLTFGTYSLGPFVGSFLSRFPNMQIDLVLSDRLVDPIEEGFEVVLRIGELGDSSMIARKLKPYRLIACASPGYIARRGAPQNREALCEQDWLVYGDGAAGPRCMWVFEGLAGPVEVQGRSRMRSNSWSALLQAAIDGHGIALGPKEALQREIDARRLQQILPGFQGPARHGQDPLLRRRPCRGVRPLTKTPPSPSRAVPATAPPRHDINLRQSHLGRAP